MIIVEGPDCVGKTTFAKKLASSTQLAMKGYIYKHFSRLPQGFNYYWGYIENAAPKSVQDRFHMSEIAYSYARGEEESPLDPQRYRMVDGYLRGRGDFTVLITCENGLLGQRLTDPGDDMYDVPTIMRAADAFNTIAHYRGKDVVIGKRVYDMDLDYHVHLTKDHPWPSNDDLQGVLKEYQRRQVEWHSAVQVQQ